MTLSTRSTISWRRRSTSAPSLAGCSVEWPAICAEDLRVGGDPLEIAIAQGRRISPGAADRLLRGRVTPLANGVAPWLLAHQREAAGRLLALLERWGGGILADATGLGKTYVALAVASATAKRATVIAPAVLRAHWLDAAHRTSVPIDFSSTESLSRGREPQGEYLVIVDEAHHFRNPRTCRYMVLARWIIRRRLLLLTATPVINRVADFVALLRLFLRDDALRAAGIASLSDVEKQPELVGTAWRVVAVARDAREAGVMASLPRRRVAKPLAVPPVPLVRLARLVDLIDSLESPGADEPRALLRLLLLRALASSGSALRASAKNQLRFVDRALEASRQGLALPRRSFKTLVAAGDPDQLSFLPLFLESHAQPVSEDALERDAQRFRQMLTLAASDDPKARTLSALIDERARRGKAVVFVNAVATARHLTRTLRGAVALTSGGGWTPTGRLPAVDALRPFQPLGRPSPALDADVLVATDLAGEGLDLHAASLVVHYDLPWTPARLAQRLGRLRRLGSPHRTVEECAFVPVASLAERLQIVTRLLDKERLGRTVNHVAAPTSAALRLPTPGTRIRHQRTRPYFVYRLAVGGYECAGAMPDLPPTAAARRLRSLLRKATRRVAAPAVVRLARRMLLTAASRAVKERSPGLLERLDSALARLSLGLNAGEMLMLEDAVADPSGRLRRLLEWVGRVGDRPSGPPSLEVFLVAPRGEQLP